MVDGEYFLCTAVLLGKLSCYTPVYLVSAVADLCTNFCVFWKHFFAIMFFGMLHLHFCQKSDVVGGTHYSSSWVPQVLDKNTLHFCEFSVEYVQEILSHVAAFDMSPWYENT